MPGDRVSHNYLSFNALGVYRTHLAYVISPFDFVDVQLNRFSRNAMPSEAAAEDPEDPRLCQHRST